MRIYKVCRYKSIEIWVKEIFFGNIERDITFAIPKKVNAALVKGLRRIPFTDESRVRFPYAVHDGLAPRF